MEVDCVVICVVYGYNILFVEIGEKIKGIFWKNFFQCFDSRYNQVGRFPSLAFILGCCGM
jgi:hypothetical protein